MSSPGRQGSYGDGSQRRLVSGASRTDMRASLNKGNSSYADNSAMTFGSSIATEVSVYDPIDQLFHLCDSAIQVEDGTYNYEERWSRVREWLDLHRDMNERAEAACRLYFNQYLNSKDNATEHMTVLHMVCYHTNPPLDIVQMLLECSDEVVTQMDNLERTPLSYACMSSTNVEVVEMLVNAYPEAIHLEDGHGNTPLFYLINKAKSMELQVSSIMTSEQDKQTLENMEEVFAVLCDNGVAEEMLSQPNPMLPLHLACALGVPPKILKILIDSYPEAVSEADHSGRTPMHYIMSNINATSSDAITLLTDEDPETVNLDDKSKEHNLPLHSLSEAFSTKRADSIEQQSLNYANSCLETYLNAKPRASPRFLNELQSLPPFLKDEAMINEHIKNVLNNKITEKVPFAFFLMDLYMYMIAVYCLYSSSKDMLLPDQDCNPDGTPFTVTALLLVGLYFVFREMMQVISLLTLGTFQSWYTDFMNLFDVLFIAIVIALGVIMVDDPCNLGNNKDFRALSVVAMTLLFLLILSFIRSFILAFSVFVNGIIYVVRSLKTFFTALLIILFAFGQIFYFIFKDEEKHCGDADPSARNPHCAMSYSLLRIVATAMGEINPSDYYESKVAFVFFAIYLFVVVILLSNVLIAIVTDNYSVIRDERADMVFWSDRLDFVSEIYAIKRLVQRGVLWLRRKDTTGLDDTGGQEDSWDREVWQDLVDFLLDKNSNDDGERSILNCCFVTAYKIVSIVFIIPIWFILGIASAGWAWPPQWRERLLAHKESLVSKNSVSVQVSKQIAELKTEVGNLRVEAKQEMKADRQQLISLKAEAESLQKDVLEDMVQIKEIMNSLLDMARSKA